jgi:hypothetical protein
MKKLIVTAMVTILALVLSMIMALPASAADAQIVGRVSGYAGGSLPNISGDVRLMSDGTLDGDWQWNLFLYAGNIVAFCGVELTSLTFPQNNVAILTGKFCCEDLPLDYMAHPEIMVDMVFEITELPDPEISGTDSNPGGLPVVLSPGTEIPSKYGNDILRVYCDGGKLIREIRGDFKVEVP